MSDLPIDSRKQLNRERPKQLTSQGIRQAIYLAIMLTLYPIGSVLGADVSRPIPAGQPVTGKKAAPVSHPADPLAGDGLECLIEPYLTVDVGTSATGVVKEVLVERGEIVKKGEVIARLDAEVEKANVEQARARVTFANGKYARMQELHKEQIVSREQLDEARSENELAQAELRKMTELLNQRTITSPLAGVVVERHISPGEFLESRKIARIAQIDPLNVEVIAPVSMLGGFKAGAKVKVFPEGPLPGPLNARVRLVDRVIDAPSGTFRVRVDLPNPGFRIAAGLRCRAQLVAASP